jgi:hypothetical protein
MAGGCMKSYEKMFKFEVELEKNNRVLPSKEETLLTLKKDLREYLLYSIKKRKEEPPLPEEEPVEEITEITPVEEVAEVGEMMKIRDEEIIGDEPVPEIPDEGKIVREDGDGELMELTEDDIIGDEEALSGSVEGKSNDAGDIIDSAIASGKMAVQDQDRDMSRKDRKKKNRKRR